VERAVEALAGEALALERESGSLARADLMLPLWDTEKQRRAPVMTLLLIAANLGVFVYQLVLMMRGESVLEGWLYQHALVPGRLLDGVTDREQWLTLVSAMFLHGGVAHVLGNVWFLWIFGGNVEDRLGAFKFLFFYLTTGVAAAGAQMLAGPMSTVPMIGASGAISGVLGAYFVLLPRAWVVALVPWIVPVVPVPAVLFLIVWFVFQAMNGVGALMSGASAGGGVAWWAFAAGVVAILFARKHGWVARR
jgi:membrane associated rhomboid family serine protease